MNTLKKDLKTYFVFDVESGGLFGDGFAFGYCVVTEEGKEIEAGWFGASIHSLAELNARQSARIWLECLKEVEANGSM